MTTPLDAVIGNASLTTFDVIVIGSGTGGSSVSTRLLRPKMLDLLQGAGAKYAFVAPIDAVPGASHLIGTLRMGTDPKTSVTDALGKFHDIANLYAADSSLWPTSSGFNPILTIVTVATRVAGNMVFPGSPEKAIA